MVANVSRIHSCADIDELVFLFGQVREAARSFAELAERFRLAPSRSRTPSVLKHDINTVFAVQAGELLCQCWRRGMFSVYRPHFYLPEESEPRLRYVFSWFTFIRWHLAPIFNNRFRADWQSEFATAVDQLRGQKDGPPPDFTAAVSDDAKELAVWRLDLCADVQETACAILAEELEQLLEVVEQRLGQLPADPGGGDADEPPPEQGGRSFSWYYDTLPNKDSMHKYGPVEGTLKELVRWIGRGSQPTLRKHNGKLWWIRKVTGKKFEVWFDSQKTFAEVNQQRLVEKQNETK